MRQRRPAQLTVGVSAGARGQRWWRDGAHISEGKIQRLADQISPLDAGRETLPADVQEHVGTVRYISATEVDQVEYLRDSQLMLGYIADDDQAYAYPTNILNFHEIVNDTLAGRPLLAIYCPLCRSGIVYRRERNGTILSFGNTSALYQNDLTMCDRQTNSYWFQTGEEAIVGTADGSVPDRASHDHVAVEIWRAIDRVEREPTTIKLHAILQPEPKYGPSVPSPSRMNLRDTAD